MAEPPRRINNLAALHVGGQIAAPLLWPHPHHTPTDTITNIRTQLAEWDSATIIGGLVCASIIITTTAETTLTHAIDYLTAHPEEQGDGFYIGIGFTRQLATDPGAAVDFFYTTIHNTSTPAAAQTFSEAVTTILTALAITADTGHPPGLH